MLRSIHVSPLPCSDLGRGVAISTTAFMLPRFFVQTPVSNVQGPPRCCQRGHGDPSNVFAAQRARDLIAHENYMDARRNRGLDGKAEKGWKGEAVGAVLHGPMHDDDRHAPGHRCPFHYPLIRASSRHSRTRLRYRVWATLLHGHRAPGGYDRRAHDSGRAMRCVGLMNKPLYCSLKWDIKRREESCGFPVLVV